MSIRLLIEHFGGGEIVILLFVLLILLLGPFVLGYAIGFSKGRRTRERNQYRFNNKNF